MISAEELSSRLLEPPYAAALAAAAARHFEPHLVVFLRRQDFLKESAFAEIVKDWYAGDIRDDDHYHSTTPGGWRRWRRPSAAAGCRWRSTATRGRTTSSATCWRRPARRSTRRASGRSRRRTSRCTGARRCSSPACRSPPAPPPTRATGWRRASSPGWWRTRTRSPTTGCASSCRRSERHALVAAHLDGNRALVDRLGLADPGPFLALPDPDAPWTPPAPIAPREVAAVRRAALAACLRGRNPVAAARLAAQVARLLAPMTGGVGRPAARTPPIPSVETACPGLYEGRVSMVVGGSGVKRVPAAAPLSAVSARRRPLPQRKECR